MRKPTAKMKKAENDALKDWWRRRRSNWRPGGFSSKPDETSGETRAHARNGEQSFRQERRQERTHKSQQRKGDAKTDGNTIEDLFATGDRAVLEWTSRSPTDYAQFCVTDNATSDDVAHAMFAALTAMRQERDRAIEMVRLLVGERKTIREYVAQNHSVRQSCDSPKLNPVYRRVGLDPECPAFLLTAARTAYRRTLHPDVHPPEKRAEAERRFKEAEAVFDEIERLRGARGHRK